MNPCIGDSEVARRCSPLAFFPACRLAAGCGPGSRRARTRVDRHSRRDRQIYFAFFVFSSLLHCGYCCVRREQRSGGGSHVVSVVVGRSCARVLGRFRASSARWPVAKAAVVAACVARWGVIGRRVRVRVRSGGELERDFELVRQSAH